MRHAWLVALAVLLPSSLIGQSVAIGAGALVPISDEDFRRLWNPGYGFGITGLLDLSESLQLQFGADYVRLGLDSGAFLNRLDEGADETDGGAVAIKAFRGGLRWSLAAAGIPVYVSGEVGYADVARSLIEIYRRRDLVAISEPEDDGGLLATLTLGGSRTLSPNAGAFIEAGYYAVFVEDSELHHLALRAGILYRP